MRLRISSLACAVMLLAATGAMATSFVVPTDDELIAKSNAIVTGTIEGSYVQEQNDTIETVYELRVDRTIKGVAKRGELLRIVSPGGLVGDERGLIVPASAHFRQGDRVLTFLTKDDGRWRTTDLTLGKFRFVTSTKGDRLLVRDMEDVVGWDRAGRVHQEKVRREEGFLHFVTERARGRQVPQADYEVDASEVTIAPEEPSVPFAVGTNAAPFPGATYTDWVNNQPIRWPNMSAGVPFYKRSDQNISGASDGGVSAIQSGLNAWNNHCASAVNLVYSGQRATASANHDGVNVVEYNDPQSRISGSWGGSGTVAITFLSFAGSHSFESRTWWNITDADVVFQNGYTAGSSGFATAMTHELGHGIGWRHSNQDYATGGSCNSSTQECTSAAIMNSSVVNNYGYTLQPWDQHAAESVYPGGTCGPVCAAPVIAAHPQSNTVSRGGSVTLHVTATGTAPLTYQWYTGASGNTSNPVPNSNSPSITVTPTATTSYWVRVTNSCGAANSNAATITVVTPTPGPNSRRRGDYDGDGITDVAVWRPSTGLWQINGTTSGAISVVWGQNGDTPVPADFDGDGRTDIAVWRPSTGYWYWRATTAGAGGLRWGEPGDIPLPGDYDGDGRADAAVWRPSTGYWYWNGTSSGGGGIRYGVPGDIPVPADYDGDGRIDVGVFRPSTGWWYWNGSTSGGGGVLWGQSGDIPRPADFDGDGRADPAVFRPSAALWYVNNTTAADAVVNWGANGDQPLPGDYDGDGKFDIAVWRPSTAWWYIRYSSRAAGGIQWGTPADVAPLAR